MSFYAPYLPITRDQTNGYKMLDDLRDVVKQNFRMLILTNPGERVMLPEFGVGIYKFLFENYGPKLNGEVASKIREQTNRYLPYITIKAIQFGTQPESVGEINTNSLNIVIDYHIKPLNYADQLRINVNQDF